MKRLIRAKKGQFLMIASFLVLVILSAAIITVYSRIHTNLLSENTSVASPVHEINHSLNQILAFTVGYYGSILQVTGNVTYAQEMANSYIQSGLTYISHSHLDWNPTFEVNNLSLATQWFEPISSSQGQLSLVYNLPTFGLTGIHRLTTASLHIKVLDTVTNQSIINVRKEGDLPDIFLSKENFFFYHYDHEVGQWTLVNPEYEPLISTDGNYTIAIPPGVDNDIYFIKVVDNRGIMASAFYSPTGKSEYALDFEWNSTFYANSTRDTLTVEFLQNGTLRWLGDSLALDLARPLPPLPVKSLRVNQTINGVNHAVPFQIEDWGSKYSVPLGLASNASILSSRTIIVFLANRNVSKTTIWWDGRDVSIQTAHAWRNQYFLADDPDHHLLSNGELTLDLSNSRQVHATVNGVRSISEFLRINDQTPTYGSALSYTIHHGIIRDIVQQEAEWFSGITDCPDVYSHIVITLPANSNYYTFSVRTIFLASTQDRDITDLSAIQLAADRGQALTEDGVTTGLPLPSLSPPTTYYNGGTAWAHHWSEYLDTNNRGSGLMFRDLTNTRLYAFDSIAGDNTGAIELVLGERKIEVNPVMRYAVTDFQAAHDLIWSGAVVTFGSGNPADTIFPYNDGYNYDAGTIYHGLWIIAEYPPSISFNLT